MEKKKITVDEFYNYITSHMTPEEALKKLLQSSLIQYEKLKFDSQEKAVHPIIIITMAAMDMGWQMAIEKTEDENADVRGICVGTPEYLDSVFKKS